MLLLAFLTVFNFKTNNNRNIILMRSAVKKRELFAALSAKRNLGPDMLQDIIIRSIYKNHTFFTNQAKNPFVNLRMY